MATMSQHWNTTSCCYWFWCMRFWSTTSATRHGKQHDREHESEHSHRFNVPANSSHSSRVSEDNTDSASDGLEASMLATPLIRLEVLMLSGLEVEVTVPNDVTVMSLRDIIEKATGVQAQEQALVMNDEQFLDPTCQPFIGLGAEAISLSLVRLRPPTPVMLIFDTLHSQDWEEIMTNAGPCSLTVLAGCRENMNDRFWPLLYDLLKRHATSVRALTVRHVQGDAKLPLNVVFRLADTLQLGLTSVDFSYVLPGATGLAVLAEALPTSVQRLRFVSCVDDGALFSQYLSALAGRLPRLASIDASGSWAPLSTEAATRIIAQTAPSGCDISLF